MIRAADATMSMNLPITVRDQGEEREMAMSGPGLDCVADKLPQKHEHLGNVSVDSTDPAGRSQGVAARKSSPRPVCGGLGVPWTIN